MINQESRERPYPYIKKALAMLPNDRRCNIVEIGSMRNTLDHDVDNYSHPCCNDGHSSVLFAMSGHWLETVDKSVAAHYNVTKHIGSKPFVRTWCMDGLEFLAQECPMPIDLLYLDAWDANYPDSAQKHLDAYTAALPLLAPECMILIDDTDVNLNAETGELEACDDPLTPGGKGLLVVPQALKDGFKLIFCGRQTLLKRSAA